MAATLTFEPDKAPEPPAPSTSDTGSQRRKKKKRARLLWVGGPLGLCMCCFMVFLFALNRNPEAQPPLPAPLEDLQATLIAAVPPEVGPTVQAVMQTAMPTEPPADAGQAEKIDLNPLDPAVAQEDVNKHPDSPRAHLIYGFALVKNGKDVELGYLEIKTAAELGAKNPIFLNGAARALDKANLPLGAAAMYLQLGARAHEADQNLDNNLLIDLRRTIYDSFDDPVAPEVFNYNEIEKVHPPLALVAQARYAITHGDPNSALKLIDELRAGSRGMPEADLLQAEFLIMTKQDIPGARKLLDGILQMPRVPAWITERTKELQKMTK